jgi:ubiquitin carboxyl-terminal hydrolase 5/13
VVLRREVFDNWVPKKLEIELQVPLDKAIDFERFRGHKAQLQEGEKPIAEAPAATQEEWVEPDLNGELLNQIIMMGVPEQAAKHALHITGNNNADMAVMWYFDNMDNPVLQTPLKVKRKGGGAKPAEATIP